MNGKAEEEEWRFGELNGATGRFFWERWMQGKGPGGEEGSSPRTKQSIEQAGYTVAILVGTERGNCSTALLLRCYCG